MTTSESLPTDLAAAHAMILAERAARLEAEAVAASAKAEAANVAGNEAPPLTFHFMRHNLEEALRALQHLEFAPRILVQEFHDRAVELSDRQIGSFKL